MRCRNDSDGQHDRERRGDATGDDPDPPTVAFRWLVEVVLLRRKEPRQHAPDGRRDRRLVQQRVAGDRIAVFRSQQTGDEAPAVIRRTTAPRRMRADGARASSPAVDRRRVARSVAAAVQPLVRAGDGDEAGPGVVTSRGDVREVRARRRRWSRRPAAAVDADIGTARRADLELGAGLLRGFGGGASIGRHDSRREARRIDDTRRIEAGGAHEVVPRRIRWSDFEPRQRAIEVQLRKLARVEVSTAPGIGEATELVELREGVGKTKAGIIGDSGVERGCEGRFGRLWLDGIDNLGDAAPGGGRGESAANGGRARHIARRLPEDGDGAARRSRWRRRERRSQKQRPAEATHDFVLYHSVVGVRFGRYELLRILGRGGMAEVFLARYVGPQGFEKRLVIKRVLPQHGHDRRFLRLFFDEARTQVSLSHGNLVPVFDFGRVGNAYFIAMEEVRGCDLGTLFAAGQKRARTLSPLLVAQIGIEVCRGLAYVHRRGFVHRDVSPRNVLVSTDGEVKLSDFGVALAAASDAAPGLRGTLAYMAPEQARGERVDGRADLFSLGMVLAEGLLGRRPRAHADETAALAAARAGEAATVEGPLAGLVERATCREPDARFADAEAMLVALEHEAAALGRKGGSAARELAACVAEWVPRANASQEGSAADDIAAVTAPTVGAETYFRDGGSEHFVDDVLHDRRRTLAGRAAFVAAAVAVVAGGAFATARVVRSARHDSGALAAPATPPPSGPRPAAVVPPSTAMPRAEPAAPVVRPTSNTSAGVGSRSRAIAPRTRSAASGVVLMRCTPWCIPSVDGEVRGGDGRNHRLELPAGVHHLSARRLDDHLDRTVEVPDGATVTVDFTFD